MAGRRLEQTRAFEVLKHLRRIHAGNEHDQSAPYSATQRGIAETLEISRARVSLVLSELEKHGFAERRLCLIPDIGRRMLAFRITHAGAAHLNNGNADARFVVFDGGGREAGSHWTWDVEKRGLPILTVDFHHTITTECGACPGHEGTGLCAGKPQPGTREALQRLRKRFRVVVFTGYGSVDGTADAKAEIGEYLTRHRIPFDEIVDGKPPACFMIDDRAVRHVSWTDTILEIEERLGGQLE